MDYRHWLPGAGETQLLQAACFEREAAMQSWEAWLQRAGSIDAAWYREGVLLPLVYRNLAPLGERVPDLSRLKGTYRMAWYRNQLRAGLVAGALEALHAAGIETLLLKGAALLAHYDRDAGARYMQDADVLVPRPAASRAVQALRAAGWTPTFFTEQQIPLDVRVQRALRLSHAIELRGPDREAQVDLHWYVAFENPCDRIDRGTWRRAIPATLREVATRVPCAEDMVVQLCINGLRPPGQTSRWAADAAVVVHAQPGLDWGLVEREARRRRAGAAVGTALGYLRSQLAVPVPVGVIERLSGQRVPLARRLEARPYETRFWRQCHFIGRYLTVAQCRSPREALALLPLHAMDHWGVPTRRAAARRALHLGWRELRIRTVRPVRRTVRQAVGIARRRG